MSQISIDQVLSQIRSIAAQAQPSGLKPLGPTNEAVPVPATALPP